MIDVVLGTESKERIVLGLKKFSLARERTFQHILSEARGRYRRGTEKRVMYSVLGPQKKLSEDDFKISASTVWQVVLAVRERWYSRQKS